MKIDKILVLALMLLATASCNKFLEVESEFKFRAELALESLEAMEQVATGMLHMFQSGGLYAGGLVANSELLADNISPNNISDFSLNQFLSYDMNPFNSEAGSLWGDGYHAIYRANVILANVDAFSDEDPDLVNTLKAEALFVRGAMHFEVLRMFAHPSGHTTDDSHLGIPIRLEPGTLTTFQDVSRSSVAEVYTQVESDLEAAYNGLPDLPSSRVSKWAAAGYLARVYFQQNDFQNAKDWCDVVIQSNRFALTDSVMDPFTTEDGTFSSEAVFQVINNGDDFNTGALGRFRQSFGTPPYKVHDNFDNWINADTLANGQRGKNWYRLFGGNYYVTKYDNEKMNILVIRLAEILLTRSECKARLGSSDADVRSDYNQIRVRGGLPEDNTTTGSDSLLAIIQYERNFELAFEGDRFHELKRRKSDFQTRIGVLSYDDNKLIYPIPQQEVEQNPNMIQNDGY